jgi:uncharacterized protein YbcV (DUF1398 family)
MVAKASAVRVIAEVKRIHLNLTLLDKVHRRKNKGETSFKVFLGAAWIGAGWRGLQKKDIG